MLLSLLTDEDAPLCQQLHYLQMTTQKLAKGLLTPPGGERYPNTHDAFVKFVSVAKGRREIWSACGFRQAEPFFAYVNSLRPLAQAVKYLSPAGGDHPNPEYPWKESGAIVSPLEYAFRDFNLRGAKMLKFIEDCSTVVQAEATP